MRRTFALLLCGVMLLLTACGGERQAAEKNHRYEVLDSTGAVLCTVTDGPLFDTLDDLLGTPAEDMEQDETAGDMEPLYTYVYCQEKTLLAGEDPDGERDYAELIQILVPAEGTTIAVQVLPDMDALDAADGLDWLTEAVDLEALLTSAVTVPPETMETLRSPNQLEE